MVPADPIVHVCLNAPASPASPPEIPTFLGSTDCRPNTKPLPLIFTPTPNTITADKSSAGNDIARRAPASNESSIPFKGVDVLKTLVFSNLTQLMTHVSSYTRSTAISPAVEQPAMVDVGASLRSVFDKCWVWKNGIDPKTSIKSGCKSVMKSS